MKKVKAVKTEKSVSELSALCWRPPEFQELETLLGTMEEALRDSERRYRILAENAADAIWTVDMNMHLTYASPSITHLLGFSVEEVMAKAMEEVFTPASFELVTKAFVAERELEKQERKDMSRSRMLELELNHKDGRIVPVEIRYSFLRDRAGKPVEILAIARDITERKRAVDRDYQTAAKLLSVLEGTMQAMSVAVELRDPYTTGHQQRVGKLASTIAREMGLLEDQINGLRLTGLVHDIGKIQVPSEILTYPDKLSEAQFSIIKMHPVAGYDILKNIEFPWPVATTVLQHHERMNGTGYPSGLSGKNILLEARILAVADVVEAMSSNRPYRQSLGLHYTLEEISQNKNVLYDNEVVDACLRLFAENRFRFEH